MKCFYPFLFMLLWLGQQSVQATERTSVTGHIIVSATILSYGKASVIIESEEHTPTESLYGFRLQIKTNVKVLPQLFATLAQESSDIYILNGTVLSVGQYVLVNPEEINELRIIPSGESLTSESKVVLSVLF